VIRKFGAVLESELPWDGGWPPAPRGLQRVRRRRRIVAYFNLGDDSARPRRLRRLAPLAAEHGPVARAVQLDGTSPTRSSTRFDAGSVDGSHAAALFGYGPDHFLLRSSWGPDWGDGGYARMSLATPRRR
jgi:hypothetical protein